MSNRYLAVAIFVVAGIALFALGIFLVGNRHEAFSRHLLLFTELRDVDGLTKGSKVRVGGMDAGQVMDIQVPNAPDSGFRVQMRINERLHGLVRADSVVTVDTEGVVGETFLSIHPGSATSPIAPAGASLRSKPAIAMSDLLTNGLVVMNDADAALKQVSGKLNIALDGVTGAVDNANDLLVGLKEGRGPVGVLLRDEKMASQLRETMANVQSTTLNLNQASVKVNALVGDVEGRQLPQKIDDTVTQIRSASTEVRATVDQVHQSLNEALGPDVDGVTAGQNISRTLTNVDVATGNMAEDTEALKHNFFFKGFFKNRGYYSLASMSPEEYRRNKLFSAGDGLRSWIAADTLFRSGPEGTEELTAAGRRAVDQIVVNAGNAVFNHPVIVEGYSDAATPADQLAISYSRGVLVRNYLEARFPFAAKSIGVMPLSSEPPANAGHDRWSGVSILIPEKK